MEPKSVQVGPWAIIVHKSPARVQILKSPCKSKTRTCCICIDMKIENVLPAAVGSMILKITYSNQFPPSTAFSLKCFTGYSLSKIMLHLHRHEHRKCASCLGGEHDFKNYICEPKAKMLKKYLFLNTFWTISRPYALSGRGPTGGRSIGGYAPRGGFRRGTF